jgi:gluconate 5-dehydrogenase
VGNVEEVSAEDWTRIFDVNVRGYALMAKHIGPIMKKQKYGSIVNIASTLGLLAIPDAAPYSATKGAILQLTRNLALDLGSFNIRVNSVSPGSIDSPGRNELAKKNNMTVEQMNEMCMEGSCLKRIGQAQDIANLIVFVISDLCPFMTGANLVADGGNLII